MKNSLSTYQLEEQTQRDKALVQNKLTLVQVLERERAGQCFIGKSDKTERYSGMYLEKDKSLKSYKMTFYSFLLLFKYEIF